MSALLELTNISRVYSGPHGDIRALDNVSLTLEPGQFTAVVGPSGCGKTTLLLCAGALLKPSAGGVTIDGTDPYALSGDARAHLRARSIGFVFQQFHLVPFLSVLDNVLAPGMALGGNAHRDVRRRAEELIERFGLMSRRDHVPAALSSGERQRTALARSLLNGPKLLLADEPTGNLDGENAHIVLTHLREFASSGGAVLLVTHDEPGLAPSDTLVRLHNGQRVSGADQQ